LDNLALAATTDWDIVQQLTNINQQLTTTIKLLTEQLQKALATNTVLANKVTANPNNTKTPGGHKPFNRAEWEAKLDPTGYCWLHGYWVLKGHNSETCKGKLGGHKDSATQADIQGGSIKGKEWHIGDPHRTKINIQQENTMCQTPPTSTITGITDTGASGHYIRPHNTHNTDSTTKLPTIVGLPNGVCLQSTTTNCTLALPQLPEAALDAHILPGLTHSSLISIGKLCNAGCTAIFNAQTVTINKNNTTLLHGNCEFRTGLW
jgi:hypothetical protein